MKRQALPQGATDQKSPYPAPGWSRSLLSKVCFLVPEGSQLISSLPLASSDLITWLEIEASLSLPCWKVNSCSPWVNMKVTRSPLSRSIRKDDFPALAVRTAGLSTQELRRQRISYSSGLFSHLSPPSSLCWWGFVS